MSPIPYSEVDDWQSVELTIGDMKIRGLFTILRVQPDSAPKGLHVYDIRHGDENDWTDMVSIENHVVVNHCGSFVTGRDLKLPKWGYQITHYEYL